MYDSVRLKSDCVGGVFNGLIFSGCWGFVHGSYYGYTPPITSRNYLKSIGRYTRQSSLVLTPLFTIARITNNYCRDSGYSAGQSSLATFAVCFGILMVFQKKINI